MHDERSSCRVEEAVDCVPSRKSTTTRKRNISMSDIISQTNQTVITGLVPFCRLNYPFSSLIFEEEQPLKADASCQVSVYLFPT